MNFILSLMALGAMLATGGSAADLPELPKGVAPLVGTAVVVSRPERAGSAWRIELTVPRVRWEEIGEDPDGKLDRRRRELRAEVEKVTLTLTLDGPSAVAPSRVVDMNGQDVEREEVLRRLKSETPVLVSVSGDMVEPYYLQVVRPETLIILLGSRERAPRPGLLPAAKGSLETQETLKPGDE